VNDTGNNLFWNCFMRVYLDNNVLVDIEDGNLRLSDFISIQNVEYYYSEAHLNELLEATSNPNVSQGRRLELITKLCGTNSILANPHNPPDICSKSPDEMYSFVDTPLRTMINMFVLRDTDVFQSIRQHLGFDSRSFNNVKPDEVLGVLDLRMQEKFNIGLVQYLCQSEALSGRTLFVTLLDIIDAANYWGDRKTAHSEVARLNDASHAYYAQICDILVTNDKKMIAKVNVIYSFLGVDTKVLTVRDFLNLKFV